MRYGSSHQYFDSVLRIRYTGLDDDPPIVEIKVEEEYYPVGSTLHLSGLRSYETKSNNL
jgi:hypothetical protein